MQIKTEGLALHTIQYGDTSLIVKLLTKELGNLTFMIKGARRKKSGKSRGYFAPMQHLYLEFQYHPNKNFQILKEVRVNPAYMLMHTHPLKSTVLLFCAEFLYKIFDKQESGKETYSIGLNLLNQLRSTKNVSNFPIIFVLAVLKNLGYYPQNNFSPNRPVFSMENGCFVEIGDNLNQHLCTPAVSASISKILISSDDSLSLTSRQQLLPVLLEYTAIQIDKPIHIRSVDVLHSLLKT